MPQMAPLWWEILFMLFITSFIMMTIIVYYLFNNKMKKNSCNIKSINQLNWKW